MKQKIAVFIFGLSALIAVSSFNGAAQVKSGGEGQIKINFAELPVGTAVSEKFIDKNVLISAIQGDVTIVKDSVVGKNGLCAKKILTNVLGDPYPICGEIYIGFVSADQKMVKRFAKNIIVEVVAVGSVVAGWFDKEGQLKIENVGTGFPQPTFRFTIPADQTEGVAVKSPDDCSLCSLMVTGISFDLVQSNDEFCGEPIVDADYSHRRLWEENYSAAIYQRLDEFRPKPKAALPITLQNLLPDRTTYIDEFAIIVRLPGDGYSMAKDIFRDMRRRLDTVGSGDDAVAFKEMGTFRYLEPDKIKANPDGLPAVGDIFLIDIEGPDNGDVMMTSLYESLVSSRFRYSTLNNQLNRYSLSSKKRGNLRHPNNGSREYGYTYELNGTTKFFVRGVDQFDIRSASLIGLPRQKRLWLHFLNGIGQRVVKNKGKVIYPAEKTIDKSIPVLPKCHVVIAPDYGTLPF